MQQSQELKGISGAVDHLTSIYMSFGAEHSMAKAAAIIVIRENELMGARTRTHAEKVTMAVIDLQVDKKKLTSQMQGIEEEIQRIDELIATYTRFGAPLSTEGVIAPLN